MVQTRYAQRNGSVKKVHFNQITFDADFALLRTLKFGSAAAGGPGMDEIMLKGNGSVYLLGINKFHFDSLGF